MDPKFLDFAYRSPLLKRYIHMLNPDIACLQEVDKMDFFKSCFPPNFEVMWKPKYDADGIFVAINKDKFEISSSQAVHYENSEGEKLGQFFWYIYLKHKESSQKLLLITTHLKAKQEFEALRVEEVKFLLDYIKKDKNYQQKTMPLIICGDLNAHPDWDSVKLLQAELLLPNLFLGSEFTTYKIRKTVEQRIIDYMFYTPEALVPVNIVSLPKKSEVDNIGYPAIDFPSDHLFLSAQFLIPDSSAQKKGPEK